MRSRRPFVVAGCQQADEHERDERNAHHCVTISTAMSDESLVPSLFRARLIWPSRGLEVRLGPPGREPDCGRHQRDSPEKGVCVSIVSIVSMVSGLPEGWLSVAVVVADGADRPDVVFDSPHLTPGMSPTD